MSLILLGLVQGLTEFFPISSSGHLVILENLLKLNLPGAAFEVFLHFGTLLSVLFVFRREVRCVPVTSILSVAGPGAFNY